MGELIHLGIIMDGNGRWAEKRGLRRSLGHEEGSKAAKRVTDALLDEGTVKFLTLYCFSTENWKRPQKETSFLMGLLHKALSLYIAEYNAKGVRFLHLGRKDRIPGFLAEELVEAEAATRQNGRMTVQLAIDYGGEDELERVITKAVNAGEKSFKYSNLSKYMDNPEVPPPDMIIRSGGEQRLSGFLLLSSSYAEIKSYDRLWPDWDEGMALQALSDFRIRNRRFGGL